MSGAYRLLRPLLFALDPETAHRMSIRALRAGLHPRARAADRRLAVNALGLAFPNPVGLAAGYDKNGEAVDALLALGFGFVEVGTVTPRPQPGNPRPRVFRLTRERAIVNRLGFNNDGHDAVHRRLAARRRAGIVGVNLGANRDSDDRTGDYVAGVTRFADIADYLVINVSSPNTPGLRDLQERGALAALLARVVAARDAASRRVPLLLKIAPDLDDAALAAIAEEAVGAGIDGMIVANTTVSRQGLAGAPAADAAGGLSGAPLYRASTAMLARLRPRVSRRMVLIGAGGVDSVDAAVGKIRAGADLVQLYTGLVYEGPGLPERIVGGLARRLRDEGVGSVAELTGVAAGPAGGALDSGGASPLN